ncbi:MAG TPA: hypothetical protein VJL86_05030 [Steroidobacteraceae bacterium]|nr:hypothetical protein [Steroidobacteraceae bacterium]
MHCIRIPANATALLVSLALANGGALLPIEAYAQTKPTVTVINPVSNPVNSRITNSVLAVEVSNADPIPVTIPDPEATREIFFKVVNVSISGGGGCNPNDPIVVPAGKRLVIEYVSAHGTISAPAEIVRFMLRQPSAPDDFLVVPAGKSAAGVDTNHSAGGQYVHAYTDGDLWACGVPSTSAGAGAVHVSVIGYLLDKP